MSTEHITHRGLKRAAGIIVLAGLVAAAVAVSLPREAPEPTRERIEAEAARQPGFAALLSVRFDELEYTGQQAARRVAVDFVVGLGVSADTLARSMRAAGDGVLRTVEVSQKLVVTGYRDTFEFEQGLPFAARAVYLAPELAAPLDGWMTVRVPDGTTAPERAFERIYARPSVSVSAGAAAVTVDLDAERQSRPVSGLMDILAEPFIDTFDHDNIFARLPGDFERVAVTVTRAGETLGRVEMTRAAHRAAAVPRLRAALSQKALAISAEEVAFAQKYDAGGLYSPLVFDAVVTAEDRAALAVLKARRRAVEEEFYAALFAGATAELSPDAPAAVEVSGDTAAAP